MEEMWSTFCLITTYIKQTWDKQTTFNWIRTRIFGKSDLDLVQKSYDHSWISLLSYLTSPPPRLSAAGQSPPHSDQPAQKTQRFICNQSGENSYIFLFSQYCISNFLCRFSKERITRKRIQKDILEVLKLHYQAGFGRFDKSDQYSVKWIFYYCQQKQSLTAQSRNGKA